MLFITVIFVCLFITDIAAQDDILELPPTTPAVSFSIDSDENCIDRDQHCIEYVSRNASDCTEVPYVIVNCEKTCLLCGPSNGKFDVRNVPVSLRSIAFLLGIWRAESGGKAIFPTMPVFTYGEEIEISLPDSAMQGLNALNYTAHAWDMNNHQALHSEHGYITMKPGTKEVALTTVMDNGFVTIEEGTVRGRTISFKLVDIGRISFSRDLPVHGTEREWRLINGETFEHRFFMETLTHRMQLHTSIVYRKIFPR